MLVERSADNPNAMNQALVHLEAIARTHEGIKEIAVCPHFLEALLCISSRTSPGTDENGSRSSLLSNLLVKTAKEQSCRRPMLIHLSELLLPNGRGAEAPEEQFLRACPSMTPEAQDALLELIEEVVIRGGPSMKPQRCCALILSFLRAQQEDFQAMGLRVLRGLVDPSSDYVCEDLLSSSGQLTPKTVNNVLLKLIQRHPQLCLDTLALLALKDEFRDYMSSQSSLLVFLAHCCQQPSDPRKETLGDAARRTAAKCLANLSAHPAVRVWCKQSSGLRSAFAASDDPAVRAYLGMALGANS